MAKENEFEKTRTIKEKVLKILNERHDFWSNDLSRYKNSKPPNITMIAQTEAIMDELILLIRECGQL